MPALDHESDLILSENIVETVRQPLLILDDHLRVIKANPSFYRTFQVSPEDTLNQSIYEFDNGQWDIPALRGLLEGISADQNRGEELEVERTFERIGFRSILVNARRVLHTSEFVLLAIEDITQRKQDEKVRLFLGSLVESSEDAIVTVDFDGLITTWNHTAERVYGYRAGEVIGRRLDVLSIPEEKIPVSTYLEKIRTGIPVDRVEIERVTKDGRRIWLSIQFSPIKDHSGRIIGVSTISRDITRRHESREALNHSEALLQKALSSKAVGVLFFNLNGGFSNANETFTRMSGYTADELRKSVHWKILTAPEFLDASFRTAESLATTGEAVPYEKQMIRKDGSRWWGLFAPRRLNDRGWDSDCMEFIIDITERKQVEQQLHSQRLLLETMVHHLPAGVALLRGRDLSFKMVNPRYQALSPGRQMVGKTIAEVWPEAMPQVEERFRRVFETGTPFHIVDEPYRVRRVPDRPVESLFFSWSIYPIDLPGERESGLLVAVWETTQRKSAEQALRDSEEQFRTLAETIPQLAWMTDENGWIFWYNRRWYEFTGTSLEEMQGWGWEKVHHPDHIDRVKAFWKAALEKGESWEDTFPLRGKDGKFRWFLSGAFPIRNESGNIVRWFGTNTDVTDLREAQAALSEREAVLRAVTHEARVGLVMVSADGTYLFANQTYAEILRLPDSNIVGKKVSEVLPGAYEDQIKPRLERAIAGERVSYELRLPEGQGEGERIFEVTYEPRVDARGQYVVVVIVDVTERKKAQEILERTVGERTAALQEINKQMEAFTYTIAHDLRAPLRAQQGFASALLQDYGDALGETGRDFAERIIGSALRLDHLVNDLLAFSRISRTEMQLHRIDLRRIVSDVCHELAFQVHESKAKIQIENLDFRLCGHEPTVRTAVTNLITNALKFTSPGVPPHIRIWAESRGKCVRLWVEDNGIGIPPEHHHQIFGVFHRLHRFGEYPGTGVGLAIVQKGIERMGGSVGVESEVGRGSRFWVQLENAES